MFVLSSYQKKVLYFFYFLLFYWIILYFFGHKDSIYNYLFSFLFSLVPLVGGIYGLNLSNEWGRLRSVVGGGIFFISAGLFSWGAGSMVWSYYNFFLEVAAPYPSLADIGFILSVPCWLIGIVKLAKATGAKSGLKHKKGIFLLFLLPFLISALSYYLLVVIARGGVLIGEPGIIDMKLFLDLAYPIGDIIILTSALLVYTLSANYLGGFYKHNALFVLSGFVLMYFADFIFSYTTTLETFYVGNFGDLIFAVALSTITFGILGFKHRNE